MTTTLTQAKEKADIRKLRQDREKSLASLSKQPKLSSAEAVANYSRRLERGQQTQEAV